MFICTICQQLNAIIRFVLQQIGLEIFDLDGVEMLITQINRKEVKCSVSGVDHLVLDSAPISNTEIEVTERLMFAGLIR